MCVNIYNFYGLYDTLAIAMQVNPLYIRVCVCTYIHRERERGREKGIYSLDASAAHCGLFCSCSR